MSFRDSHYPQRAGNAVVRSLDHFPHFLNIPTRLLGAICACVFSGILVAGLWPFHAPRNDVSWLTGSNGLFFGKHGSIVSDGSYAAIRWSGGDACTLEIWLEPHRVDYAGTILAFYRPTSRVTPFSLRQSLTDLKLEGIAQDGSAQRARIFVDLFSSLRPVFVTISSGESGIAIYVDGTLVRKSSSFRILGSELTGQLIVGNAPSTADSWSGQVRALAVYDRELPSSAVAQHFADWTMGTPPPKSEGAVAIYRFDERAGNIVHSQVDSAQDLLIPAHFFVLNEQFLERPWNEFRPDWYFWEDVAINIGGFIPFGFFFTAYLSSTKKIKHADCLTIVLGFSVSLTIEVLQSFLPTRNSGITDLLTNTLGTSIGAILFVWCLKRDNGYGWRSKSIAAS